MNCHPFLEVIWGFFFFYLPGYMQQEIKISFFVSTNIRYVLFSYSVGSAGTEDDVALTTKGSSRREAFPSFSLL